MLSIYIIWSWAYMNLRQLVASLSRRDQSPAMAAYLALKLIIFQLINQSFDQSIKLL